MADPADLSNLRDIALPAEVSLWPPAAGWWIVAAAALVTAAILAVMALMRYRRDAYRREALRALAAADAEAIPVILKRAALAAWPREQVASLNGADWLAFLDRTGRTTAFTAGPGRHLETLAFGGSTAAEDAAAVRGVARDWLRHHRARPG